MVTNITSLTGNGLKDWLIQRVSAVFISIYAFVIIGFFLTHPDIEYSDWAEFFDCIWIQVASVLALISISFHAWIGIWTVTTDYIESSFLRIMTQIIMILWIIAQFFWGIMIIWGL